MKRLSLFLLSTLFFASCNEKETVKPQTQEVKTTKDVKLVEGVLSFSSQDHLKNVIREISVSKEMESWYSNPDFVSLFKRQKSISLKEYDKIGETGDFGKLSDVLTFRGEGEDKILGKIVEHSGLSAVLNSKSYVIVSDTVYHISANHVTSIHIGENLRNLSSFLKNPNMPGARTVKIEKISLNNARTTSDFRHTVGDRRIYASNEIIGYGGLGDYRKCYVEYLKKNWIGWSRTAAPYLSITVTAWSAPYGGTQYPPYKVEGWNTEYVEVLTQESSFGELVYHRFVAHMYCITPHETYDRDF